MTIYFTASLRGKPALEAYYQRIVNHLAKQGHAVIADQILKHTSDDVSHQSQKERLEYFHEVEQWLGECDCVVAEISHRSVSVGYEISRAQHRKKPILILYRDCTPPTLLAYQPDEPKRISPFTMLRTVGMFQEQMPGWTLVCIDKTTCITDPYTLMLWGKDHRF